MQGRGNILLRLSITLLGAFLLEKVCGEEDTQEHCSYWAAQGECAKNPDWMLPNCPLACEDAGKIDGLPIDPNDDNYERNTNDKIADQPTEEEFKEDGDPTERAGLYEGDIDMAYHEVRLRNMTNGSHRKLRNAIKRQSARWSGGVIPYTIANSFNTKERGVIAKAMREYKENTCIRFVPRVRQKDFIHIMKGSGCSSSVGRCGSKQQVSLGTGCVYTGIVIHELMHATGFWHEQSRSDRDGYVKIMRQNIQSSMVYNFDKMNLYQIDLLKAEYDTCSVMHYNEYAFSKNRKATIQRVGHSHNDCKMGQREGFSETDIRKINTLYHCDGYKQVGKDGGSTGGRQTTTQRPITTTAKYKNHKCEDTHIYCATWASDGECAKNPDWMLPNCPVACKDCDVGCADLNEHCPAWKESGECDENKEYMDIYCKKSCLCGDECNDQNEYCEKWGEMGYCTNDKWRKYMLLRCKKTCKKC